jgi:type II secretory pathway predicted ATPase ExeA
MSYYRLLGFEKEPFSTSPDPDFFYLTREHDVALTNILIELRLRRGLSVILGDIGTGKTTLSRKLIRCLKERGDFIFHIVLDPCFDNEQLFLRSLVRNFEINFEAAGGMFQKTGEVTVLDLKEALEKFLYQKTIVENKTVVLVVDEAQKLSNTAIEMLRIILNYETNESKLLQLVLLGQLELHSKIISIPNFFDRISFKYTLNPLGFEETRDMISFRIRQAGYQSKYPLFSDDAIAMIHKTAKGYPRKITLLCHRALKNIVVRKKWVVDESVVRELIDEDVHSGWLTPILQ